MASQTRNPTSDVSFTGTWTGVAGSRWQSLDDHPDAGNPVADSVTHGTTAGEGLCGFSAFNVPAGSVVSSVEVLVCAFRNGSQASTFQGRLRCNDVTGRNSPDGVTQPGNGNAALTTVAKVYPTNPKTSAAWTVNDVNGVGTNAITAFGIVSADASPTITFSSFQLRVNYQPPITGAGAATITLGRSATGSVLVTGNGSSALTFTGSGSGTVGAAGITGQGSAVLSLTGSGSGSVVVSGVGSAPLSLTGSGAGSVAIIAGGSANLSLSQSASGSVIVSGAGSSVIACSGSGEGVVRVTGNGAATISFSGSGTGGGSGVVGQGSSVLVFTGSGTAHVNGTNSYRPWREDLRPWKVWL